MACNKIKQESFGNEEKEIINNITTAVQEGDMKKVAQLGKQFNELICCGIWQTKSCMTKAMKKCSLADQDNLANVFKTATEEFEASICKDYPSHSSVCASGPSKISINISQKCKMADQDKIATFLNTMAEMMVASLCKD